MAKDDYFVIVYQILAYLYQRLKKGESVDTAMLGCDSPLFKINKQYWAYILYNLQTSGLVDVIAHAHMQGILKNFLQR